VFAGDTWLSSVDLKHTINNLNNPDNPDNPPLIYLETLSDSPDNPVERAFQLRAVPNSLKALSLTEILLNNPSNPSSPGSIVSEEEDFIRANGIYMYIHIYRVIYI